MNNTARVIEFPVDQEKKDRIAAVRAAALRPKKNKNLRRSLDHRKLSTLGLSRPTLFQRVRFALLGIFS